MTNHSAGDEQPAIRARVPSHVADGQLSTGLIVVTAPTEFVLDFVRSLPRPALVVARVVLPHVVLPQFIDALERNIDLYTRRFGPIATNADRNTPPRSVQGVTNPFGEPIDVLPTASSSAASDEAEAPSEDPRAAADDRDADASPRQRQSRAIDPPAADGTAAENDPPTDGETLAEQRDSLNKSAHGKSAVNPPPAGSSPTGEAADDSIGRHANPHEVYDDLKLRDEQLSGVYSNAVMIGHGQYEFSFDFITNFYPQSAVSARIFMASGHVPRMLQSLRMAWQQAKPRHP